MLAGINVSVSVHCFFFMLSFSSYVFSLTVEQIPRASVQKTIDLFSPEPLQQQVDLQGSVSSFSVNLYSHDTLHRPVRNSYRDLILSWLKRDSTRVNFLYRKLNSALYRNKSSEFELSNAEVSVTSGASEGSGEYFAKLGLGTPSKEFYVAIDTGSHITWVQCKPCVVCYKQTGPIFDPSMSSSYKRLTCDSSPCKQLAKNGGCSTLSTTSNCTYKASYGDGSHTTGDYATETLMLGKSSIKDFAFGCGHHNQGIFVGAGGLLGLGRSPTSLPSQINSTTFSYCLVDRGSTSASTLDFGSQVTNNNTVTAKLLKGLAYYYYVDLTGVSVGGKMLPISPSVFAIEASGNGGVIVDSGTVITRFKTEVYNQLRDLFVEATKGIKRAKGDVALLDTCYDLSSTPSVKFPTVAFHFGAKSLVLPATNVLVALDKGISCLAFAHIRPSSPKSLSVSIIGNFQQQRMRVSFDLGRSLIGFSPNSC